MRWHVPLSRNSRKKSNTSSLSIFGVPSSKSRRRLQDTEIYSKLYYKDRILPVVRERLESIKDHKGPIIQIIREVTKDLWSNENPDIRAEVATKMEEQVLEQENGEEDAQRTPQQYQE
jgi:hypothetical protein